MLIKERIEIDGKNMYNMFEDWLGECLGLLILSLEAFLKFCPMWHLFLPSLQARPGDVF